MVSVSAIIDVLYMKEQRHSRKKKIGKKHKENHSIGTKVNLQPRSIIKIRLDGVDNGMVAKRLQPEKKKQLIDALVR